MGVNHFSCKLAVDGGTLTGILSKCQQGVCVGVGRYFRNALLVDVTGPVVYHIEHSRGRLNYHTDCIEVVGTHMIYISIIIHKGIVVHSGRNVTVTVEEGNTVNIVESAVSGGIVMEVTNGRKLRVGFHSVIT